MADTVTGIGEITAESMYGHLTDEQKVTMKLTCHHCRASEVWFSVDGGQDWVPGVIQWRKDHTPNKCRGSRARS